MPALALLIVVGIACYFTAVTYLSVKRRRRPSQVLLATAIAALVGFAAMAISSGLEADRNGTSGSLTGAGWALGWLSVLALILAGLFIYLPRSASQKQR